LNTFQTAELGKAFVWELAALRNKVKLLLSEMEGALEAASKAADSLNELVGNLQCNIDIHAPLPKAPWQELAADPSRKISAIKAYREEHGVGLAEAKRAVEEYMQKG
jgi:ribosomal protein L7/L12